MISGEYRDALRVVASEPMRILQVIPTYLPATRYGGPIVGVHALARALIARGHDVEVVTTNVNGAGASPVPLGTRVEIDSVPVRYFASPWLERLCFAPAMASVLRAEMSQFDIAHLHSVFLWPTYAAVGAAQAAKVPYVVSPRGMLVGDLIRRRNRLVKSAWIALFERSNLECAAAIHATSRTEAAELDRFRWRLPPVTVIPNGVATDDGNDCVGTDVSSDVREIAATSPLVLFLGRISWKKGPDRLLHAFARTHCGTLAIVGPDDEGLTPRLRVLARSLGIADRVRFLPRAVLGADKAHLYRAARVFVLPSFSENFGNTVLEAMQSGRPVVVTPEVGAAEIVRTAGGGIVADGDPASFGAAIDRLLADRVLADEMGAAGCRHVRANLSWAGIAADTEACPIAPQARDARAPLPEPQRP
jgi:glycosyltransferase involved in cell wall biosynthesis